MSSGATDRSLPREIRQTLDSHRLRRKRSGSARKQWLAVDALYCLLRVEREKRSLRVDQTVSNSSFLVLVHERFANIGIVRVASRGAANERGPIRDRFLARGRRKVFAGRQNGGGGSDRAHRRHVDMLCGERDDRPRRAGV